VFSSDTHFWGVRYINYVFCSLDFSHFLKKSNEYYQSLFQETIPSNQDKESAKIMTIFAFLA